MRIAARWALLGEELVSNVAVTIEADHIAAVDRGGHGRADTEVELLTPGFANAHSHAFHRALRGRVGLGADFWAWRHAMLALAERLDPERYRRLAYLVDRELLLGGYTTIAEFHYVHRGTASQSLASPNAMGEALVDAAQAAGCRLTLVDAAYLHPEPSRRAWSALDGPARRFADTSVEAYLARVSEIDEGPLVRVQHAAHSLRTCRPEELSEIAAAAHRGWHLHLVEQPREVAMVEAAYGAPPVAVLERHGLLSERLVAVHLNAATDPELTTLADHGVWLAACPSTEEDLGDGLSPAARYRALGGRVLLGSDEQVVSDALAEASRLEAHARLQARARRGFAPEALWRVLTAHAPLGWPEVGRIEVGAAADLVALDLDDVTLAGVHPHALPVVGPAGRVSRVWVAGRLRVEDAASERRELSRELAAVIRELWSER